MPFDRWPPLDHSRDDAFDGEDGCEGVPPPAEPSKSALHRRRYALTTATPDSEKDLHDIERTFLGKMDAPASESDAAAPAVHDERRTEVQRRGVMEQEPDAVYLEE